MGKQPEREAIRHFIDLMRKGDTQSAYEAVEKMRFSDFADALRPAQRQGQPAENIEAIGRRRAARSTQRLRDMLDRAARKYDSEQSRPHNFDEPTV